MHDYNVNGTQKRFIYYYLSVIAIGLSSLVPLLLGVFNDVTGIALSLTVSSAAIFSLLYFVFDRLLWRLPFLGIPDFTGDWKCEGFSYKYDDSAEQEWSGVVHVQQTWDKILVTLETANSKSASVSLSANVEALPGHGFRLKYLYSNEPLPGNKELHSHYGYSNILFTKDLGSGVGKYFTNEERKTYGTMNLTKVKK